MVYDKAKAHEYYLQNRRLKGRRRGGVVPPRGSNPQTLKLLEKHTPNKKHGHEAEVAALKARLEKLRDVLAKLVEQAKKRSGVDSPKKSTAKRSASGSGGGKDSKASPLTAKQKREASARAKKSYEKNKDKNQQSPSNEIEELQKKIADIRAQIKAAIERAHKQSKSKTAGKAVRH